MYFTIRNSIKVPVGSDTVILICILELVMLYAGNAVILHKEILIIGERIN